MSHLRLFHPDNIVENSTSLISKVVWPNRRETTITTVMVFIMSKQKK